MTQRERGRRIPADSFRVRLAIVRTLMGWNYDQAEAATGIGSESWRQWEKGLRHCTDVIGASRKIAEATDFDQSWLALGGPLAEEEQGPLRPARRRAGIAATRQVRTSSTGECMSSPRPGRSPVPRNHPINRYRFRATDNQLADVTAVA